MDQVIKTLAYQTLIAVIRDTVRRFEEGEYRQLLSQISSPAPVPASQRRPSRRRRHRAETGLRHLPLAASRL